MKTIGDLLVRDLKQKIEEIIKVDQTDEQSVYTEITEYIATDRIKEQYRKLFKDIADAPSDPHEGVGVWVSGFFGSGKSSFAKNLGYVLANRKVLDQSASDLFLAQVNDKRLSEWAKLINVRIPTEVIMFDIQTDRSKSGHTKQEFSDFLYRVLLRELGYADEFDLAELEISLESEGKLEEFIQRYDERYAALDKEGKGSWLQRGRKNTQVWNRSGVILHELFPDTYRTPESFAQSLAHQRVQVTPALLVERTFELAGRRCPGKAIAFIVDEVGQYVAYSKERLEDLRKVIELFGKESKNRIKARRAIAPVWVIVTSQEKLDEVTSAMGDEKRVLLAKVRDRFKYEIDLAPADIHEVATKRVLAKKEAAVPVLKKLFAESQGQLNAACRLERTARRSEITEDEFIQFYPYLPHFVELSIDIMSGIRLQPGATKHLGGSNRTIIKQAYEMLVSERTNMAARAIGTLVTLDKIFELVEGNLSSEKQRDLSNVVQIFKDDAEDRGMTSRVAKTVCLLEFVRDLPRTEANIAACLVAEVGEPAPLAEVQKALTKLEKAQFIRNTEEGWKLQTAQEKNWESEKRHWKEPKPKDRNDILREILREIFTDPKLKTYSTKIGQRSFPVGISVDGIRVGDEGKVPLSLVIAEETETFPEKLAEVRQESRQEAHKHDLYWIFALTPEIDDLVANLFASRQMVSKYDQLRAQNRITNEEAACLADEKNETIRLRSRLQEKVIEALEKGQGLFRGVSKDAATLGKTASEIFKKFFDYAVPDLYPKLEMGSRPLKGTEAEEILKAANLNGISQAFYGSEKGLNLVVKEGSNFVVNQAAEVAKEVLDYLNREQAYGNKDTRTGRALEIHFGGLGYGWELDVLRVILAALFRAGAIEVSSKGQRFDSYLDPNSRVPFTNTPAFRSAVFTPAKPIDLKTLKQAVENYELLTGETIDVEKNAIAAAFKKLAEDDLKLLLVVEAQARAYRLPVMNLIEDFRTTLTSVQAGAAEDSVRILAGEGKSLGEARHRLRKIREATDELGLATIQLGRVTAQEMWPVLSARGEDAGLSAQAEELKNLLNAETFYETIPQIKAKAEAVAATYRELYSNLHAHRTQSFSAAVEEIKGRMEWPSVPNAMQQTVLSPLASRACQELEIPAGATTCRNCRATVDQMESDQAALSGLKAQVIARLRELTAPQEKVERVYLSDFFAEPLDSEEAVENAIERLRAHLLKLISEGMKIVLE
jgi:hypothetical protein